MVPQLQRVDRPAGEGATLKDSVLRVIVVVRHPVLFEGLLEGDDVRVLLLDEDLDARLVDRRRGKCVDGHGQDDDEEHRQRRPATLVQHLDIVQQVHFGAAEHIGPVTVWRRRRTLAVVHHHDARLFVGGVRDERRVV